MIESDSETESECNDTAAEVEEETDAPPSPPKTLRYYFNPTHVRDLDEEAKVSVFSEFITHPLYVAAINVVVV